MKASGGRGSDQLLLYAYARGCTYVAYSEVYVFLPRIRMHTLEVEVRAVNSGGPTCRCRPVK